MLESMSKKIRGVWGPPNRSIRVWEPPRKILELSDGSKLDCNNLILNENLPLFLSKEVIVSRKHISLNTNNKTTLTTIPA